MIIEIGYTYKADKTSPAITSWTYFYVKGDDSDKAKTKAKTYWKKFCTELGYKTTQVKLNHIEPIQNGKTYTPQHIIVNESELPTARKRTSKASTRTPSVPRASRTSSRRTSKKKSV